MDDDGVARAPLLGAARAARDAQPKDLAADHELLDVVPGRSDRVQLRTDAARLGEVVGIGRGRLGFQAQGALAPAQLRGFVQRQPNGLRVAVAFVAQDGEVLLGAFVQSSLHRPWHIRSVPQNVLREDESATIACVDVTGVEVIGDHHLRLTFQDRTVGDVDFRGREWRGVLEPLRDPAYFALVAVDPEAGTIAWPNGVDRAPEPLYAEARANLAYASTSR